jgi:hypothetical protein
MKSRAFPEYSSGIVGRARDRLDSAVLGLRPSENFRRKFFQRVSESRAFGDATQWPGNPKPGFHSLMTGATSPIVHRREFVGPLDRGQIAFGHFPGEFSRQIELIGQSIANRANRHVYGERNMASPPVVAALEHAGFGERGGPIGVGLEIGQHGENFFRWAWDLYGFTAKGRGHPYLLMVLPPGVKRLEFPTARYILGIVRSGLCG